MHVAVPLLRPSNAIPINPFQLGQDDPEQEARTDALIRSQTVSLIATGGALVLGLIGTVVGAMLVPRRRGQGAAIGAGVGALAGGITAFIAARSALASKAAA